MTQLSYLNEETGTDSPPQLAAVTWLDAWFDTDFPCKPQHLTTFGYILHHDEEYILVAGEGNLETGYFRAHTAIPACLIVEIAPLAAYATTDVDTD